MVENYVSDHSYAITRHLNPTWLQNTSVMSYTQGLCSLDVHKVSRCMCAKETRTKHRELIQVPSQLLNFEYRD